MKSIDFWDITPSSPLKLNQRFGGTYRLHLQGRRISRARNQRESRFHAGFLLVLFDPEDGGDILGLCPSSSILKNSLIFLVILSVIHHRQNPLESTWRRYVRPKRRLNFSELHGIISQKLVLFIKLFCWTFFIPLVILKIKRRFGSWICFRYQVWKRKWILLSWAPLDRGSLDRDWIGPQKLCYGF
jgi:hypothetical protein